MKRFNVYRATSGSGYLLDVQSDILSGLNTRVVVPLMPRSESPIPAGRLNPTFEIEGEIIVMVTQFIAVIPESELRQSIHSLSANHQEITEALDMVFMGY